MKSIQEMIDEALIRPPRERSGKFSPSSFGQCFRKQFWNRKDEPKSNPPDARSLRVFACGNLMEKFVKDTILARNPDIKDIGKEPIEEDDIKGFADLETPDSIIDIKSQHSKSFWFSKKKDFDVKKDKFHNWLQVLFYAFKKNKPFGELAFFSKDDLCVAQYREPLDDYWRGELKTHIAILRDYWAKDELPPAKPIAKWECDYCDWHDKCFAMESERKGEVCQKQLEITK